MKEKEYICKVVLLDDSEIIFQKDYNWGMKDEINDERDKFIEICGNVFNKAFVKYITVTENPNYVKEDKEILK